MDMNVKEEINDSKTVGDVEGQDLHHQNVEVNKTEIIKNEVTDIDSSPTNTVSYGAGYTTPQNDIPMNKVGLESIKYEEDVKEEKTAPYNTGLNIKTELSDREDQVDIEHDLSYEQLESIKFEDNKLDCGNEYVEHTNARYCVLSYKSDHHKQYVNDMEAIKCKENVENESLGGNVKKCLVQQCRVHHKKTELCQSHLCDKVKSKHRLLLNDDSAEIFHCELCDLKTKFKHNLLKHYILKHDSSAEIFHCDLCNFKTKLISYLREHHRLKHDNSAEIFTCERCDFKTKNKSCYLRHHRLKHVEAPEIFHCEMCHFETKYKDNLLKHYRSKHDDRPKYFCCELCDFKTKRKYCLVRHCKAKHSD